MKPDLKGFPVIYLHPGEVVFSGKPILVSTVLGSCVSVTMFSREINFGAISHCQLPTCKGAEMSCENCTEPYKFVDCTIKKMIEKFLSKSVFKEAIEVKLFGGADVLPTQGKNAREMTIGSQNILSAMETIKKYDLKLIVSDVGGKQGRKIFYNPYTGDIYLNRLRNNGKN